MVPNALRRWFVIHFVVDVLFALPLMLAPQAVLGALGWALVDPVSTRLVAAALFGIGIESLLGRNAGVEVFRGMLNLKIIWSSGALLALSFGIIAGTNPQWLLWLLFLTFLIFNLSWVYWRAKLSST